MYIYYIVLQIKWIRIFWFNDNREVVEKDPI